MKVFRLLMICMFFAPIFGCTKYMDRPTPAGAIPPAASVSSPVAQEMKRSFETNTENNKVALNAETGNFINSTSIRQFPDVYKSNGEPRIAILLNRSLSDEVREWRTDSRIVISGQGTISDRLETERTYRENKLEGPITISKQEEIEVGGGRTNPDENYVWSFEDAFMRPFLMAGAKLVDRTAIMRIEAAARNQNKNDFDPVSPKTIEIEALSDKADIFLEIMISKFPSASTGYEFKAIAKELKTGRILATSTSLNWEGEGSAKKKAVATSSGYEFREEKEFPNIKDVSRKLALDMMESLLRIWKKN